MKEATTRAARLPLVAAALLGVAFAAAVPLDLLPFLRGPAPYPPEWQWEQRAPLVWPPPEAWMLAGLALAAIAWTGSAAAQRRERAAARAAVTVAVVLGFALPLVLLAREPAGALRTLSSRTTSNTITSYHGVAVSDAARDPLAFLRRHADLLPEFAGTAKHAATHPPGAVLFFRAALAACERWPGLGERLLEAAGIPDREFAPPLTRRARAAALLGALLLNLLAALAAWPLAALAGRLGAPPLAAARIALLWALLPGPALIAPRFDAALTLPVLGFAVLLALALAASSAARSLALAASAGACAACALQLSYGTGVFLAIAGTAVAAAGLVGADRPEPSALPRAGALVAASAGAALALAFGVPALLGADPVAGLRAALAIHREAYTAPRDYWLWLAFNPVDFAALLGVPLAVLAAFASLAALRELRRGAVTPAAAFALAVSAGLLLLVWSGASRGEVGRLWIPLMPLVLLAAVTELARSRRAALVAAGLVALSTFVIAAAWRL